MEDKRLIAEMLEDGTEIYRMERPYPVGSSSEEAEQIELFNWARLLEGQYPELKLMYHIPNEGKRSKAAGGRLKAAGLKSGVPDIHLPSGRGGYIGLYIELKAGKNKITQNQKDWLSGLRRCGHYTCVCYEWDTAAVIIERYLQGRIVK